MPTEVIDVLCRSLMAEFSKEVGMQALESYYFGTVLKEVQFNLRWTVQPLNLMHSILMSEAALLVTTSYHALSFNDSDVLSLACYHCRAATTTCSSWTVTGALSPRGDERPCFIRGPPSLRL